MTPRRARLVASAGALAGMLFGVAAGFLGGLMRPDPPREDARADVAPSWSNS